MATSVSQIWYQELKYIMNSKVGKLLIAHPNLSKNNPWFQRVIYIFADSEKNGTQGLIINHSTRYNVTDFIAGRGWDMPLTREHVRVGGPVNPKIIFMLHTNEWYSSSTMQVKNNIAVSCDDFMLQKLSFGDQPDAWRMTVGMCAWAPGQLEMELSGKPPYRPENSWLTADVDHSILFEYDGERQWKKSLDLSSKQTVNSWI